MTKVQFIKTTDGEELAVLPKREYERLIAQAADEDIGTARIVHNARAAVAAGNEVVLPKIVVDRLAAGENPVRVLREWREMTQAYLAAAARITQGYLSDLETGKRKGTVAMHQILARALGIPIHFLLSIAVSEAGAHPERIAIRKRAFAQIKRSRGQR